MIEYVKIETPFNRAEDGSKKLIEGDFRTIMQIGQSKYELLKEAE